MMGKEANGGLNYNYKREFIEFMIKSGVLTFGDFTTKSGRKTPYFINTGNYKTGSQAAALGEYYAACIIGNINSGKISRDIAALFGPAYKGIPLAVTAAVSLAKDHGLDLNYCYNRKEEKDHGEGGAMIGYKLRDGDKILIIEDVITAGTAVRECLPLLKAAADVKIEGLVVSVDRMERGQGKLSAIQELHEELGIATYPLVTVREIFDILYNPDENGVDGLIHKDNGLRESMERYMDEYCIK